jgi:hypothetical protein
MRRSLCFNISSNGVILAVYERDGDVGIGKIHA